MIAKANTLKILQLQGIQITKELAKDMAKVELD